MSKKTKDMKVVVFVDGPDGTDCDDEKWKKFQLVLPESYYKIVRDLLLNLYDLYERNEN